VFAGGNRRETTVQVVGAVVFSIDFRIATSWRLFARFFDVFSLLASTIRIELDRDENARRRCSSRQSADRDEKQALAMTLRSLPANRVLSHYRQPAKIKPTIVVTRAVVRLFEMAKSRRFDWWKYRAKFASVARHVHLQPQRKETGSFYFHFEKQNGLRRPVRCTFVLITRNKRFMNFPSYPSRGFSRHITKFPR